MQTRRQFLNRGLGAATLLSVSSNIPCFVPKSLAASDPQRDDGNILVIIELSGGNDGLNTIVPHRDDAYHRSHKKIGIASKRLFPLDDEIGWHPSLRALNKHWDAGHVAVVQGVGYPNPNRSHFSSSAIWHSGEPNESKQFGLGWIGRGLDRLETQSASPTMLSVGSQATPLALRGRRSIASSIQRIEQCLISKAQTKLFSKSQPSIASIGEPVAMENPMVGPIDDLWSYVQRTHTTALQTSSMLSQLKLNSSKVSYPSTKLARQLELVAKLIRAEMGTRVFYLDLPGFDTHASQLAGQRQV